ncbi:AAA-domain-containing protein [Schizophyllum commune H4-8]|uniref:AAA-domain-containing protein n=1 Tax=Schizophyllum commune (strain H4-8 / FGSC 9210) TaxID=578458 RepID=UPI002160E264|nr:AAA-domain-containing protein [Schizophyllum commune H4-8]KAI5890368.1 AAA-domain-containing protein [Schizophyllum commune H4-8]
MPRRARVHFVPLKSSLVNLPLSIYGPLLQKSVRPQSLAVHLTLVEEEGSKSKNGKVEAFVGWTGMASASSLAHFNAGSSSSSFETIEIDPQFAQDLGLAQGSLVEIGLLHDLPFAKSVGTEPVSSDDWEIIELHAGHVESTLLSQVRVAKVGQEIDVWVLGRTRVRLLVGSLDVSSKTNAALLTTDTEISIAPKPHRRGAASTKGRAPAEPSSETSSKPQTHPKSTLLRVLPSRLTAPTPEYSGPELLGYVSKSTFRKLDAGADSPGGLYKKARVKRLSPPVDPSAGPSTSNDATPAPRILSAGKEAVTEEKSEDDAETIYVGVLDGIPDRSIVLPVLTHGIEEWDMVRLVLVLASERRGTDESSVRLSLDPSSATLSTSLKPPEHPSKPSPPAQRLAGVDEIINKCIDFARHNFVLHSTAAAVHGVTGLLLTGRPGAGKTSIVRAVARLLEYDQTLLTYTLYADASAISEKPISAIKAQFDYWFDKAMWHRPAILILDDVDKLLGAEMEHTASFRARHIVELFLARFAPAARAAPLNSRGVLLIATASSSAALHPLLMQSQVFAETVNVMPPGKEGRKMILSRIVEDRMRATPDLSEDAEAPLNYTALAMQTEGYLATDLQDLVARAVHQAAMRSKDKEDTVLTSADFEEAHKGFTPLSLRDVKLEKSETAWADIGGLGDTKRILRETLEWPTKYGPIFAQSPLRLRSGLLLYGYPGCGKTLLASAVAKECGLNFISVKGPEILNKYIGASEKSVRELFERAQAAKPCVLFFDEFDSIAPKRGHDSTGVTDRVVNQMLTQMDGAEGLEGVYVLAATSRPDLIDSALLRPGRLDKSVFCNMPTAEERKDILSAVARKVALAPEVDLQHAAEATEGFSGADLQALLYNAHLEAVHESIARGPAVERSSAAADEASVEYKIIGSAGVGVASKAEQMALQRRLQQIRAKTRRPESTSRKGKGRAELPDKHLVTQEHIRRVLRSARPSVAPEEQARLARIYSAFVDDRSGELPLPPEANGVGIRASLA